MSVGCGVFAELAYVQLREKEAGHAVEVESPKVNSSVVILLAEIVAPISQSPETWIEAFPVVYPLSNVGSARMEPCIHPLHQSLGLLTSFCPVLCRTTSPPLPACRPRLPSPLRRSSTCCTPIFPSPILARSSYTRKHSAGIPQTIAEGKAKERRRGHPSRWRQGGRGGVCLGSRRRHR